MAGLPVNDQRDDRPFRMTRSEQANLFCHVAALSGGRGADDDQRPRGLECGKCLLRRRLADGDIAWVAIDRAQRLVDGPYGVSPDEVLIAAEAFQPAM